MSIRKVEFIISSYEIEPAFVVRAGRQYEHKATTVDFIIHEELYKLLLNGTEAQELIFRIDATDADGGYHPSQSLLPVQKDDKYILSYDLSYDITSVGGICKLTVIASKIDKTSNCEDMIFCSAPAFLEFEAISRNAQSKNVFERELGGILNEAKGYLIARTEINDNGELLIYYSSGAFVNAGKVMLPDTDDLPTENGQKPVKSGGVFEALTEMQSIFFNKMSNAVIGKAYGNRLCITDISPNKHNVEVALENNFLPYPYYETGKTDDNGLIWTDKGDGSIIVNGTSGTLDTPFYFFNGSTILPAGEYMFTLGNDLAVSFKICIFSRDNLIGWSEKGADIAISITEDTEITSIYIYPEGLMVFENLLIAPKLFLKDGIDYSTVRLKVYGDNILDCTEYSVNPDGTVNDVVSIYPVMNFVTSTYDTTILCKYNKDVNAMFQAVDAKLSQMKTNNTENGVFAEIADGALVINGGFVSAVENNIFYIKRGN